MVIGIALVLIRQGVSEVGHEQVILRSRMSWPTWVDQHVWDIHASSYHVVTVVVPSDVGFLPWNSFQTVGKSRRADVAKEKVLSKMLEAIHVQHFAPDAGHSWPFYFCRRQLPEKWFRWCILCGQTCSACLVDVKPGEKQIDPFLKWKYIWVPRRQKIDEIELTDRIEEALQGSRKSYDQRGSLSPGPRLECSDHHGLQTRRCKCSVLVRPQWPTVSAKATTSRRMTYHFMSGILRDGFISSIRGSLMTGSWLLQ